jgi:hypothetical protein
MALAQIGLVVLVIVVLGWAIIDIARGGGKRRDRRALSPDPGGPDDFGAIGGGHVGGGHAPHRDAGGHGGSFGDCGGGGGGGH